MLKRPDAPRDRHYRFRARQKAGVAVAPVEFDAAVVDFLVRTAWLPPDEISDRSAVGKAIAAMLQDAARR
jgi:hypothetical protein